MFWTYTRGSLQYDVMVTLILAFIFLAPRWINFNDKPADSAQHHTGIEVIRDGAGGFVYLIDAQAIPGPDVRSDLLRTIEPIAGEVSLQKYETVRDASGRTVSYRAWVRRP